MFYETMVVFTEKNIYVCDYPIQTVLRPIKQRCGLMICRIVTFSW